MFRDMITSPFDICSLRPEVSEVFQDAINMAIECERTEDIICIIDKISEVSWKEEELIRVFAYLSRFIPHAILREMNQSSDIRVLNVKVNNNQLIVYYVNKIDPFRLIVNSVWLMDIPLIISCLMLLSEYSDSEFMEGEGLVHRLCYGAPIYGDTDVYNMMMDLARELPSFVVTHI